MKAHLGGGQHNDKKKHTHLESNVRFFIRVGQVVGTRCRLHMRHPVASVEEASGVRLVRNRSSMKTQLW